MQGKKKTKTTELSKTVIGNPLLFPIYPLCCIVLFCSVLSRLLGPFRSMGEGNLRIRICKWGERKTDYHRLPFWKKGKKMSIESCIVIYFGFIPLPAAFFFISLPLHRFPPVSNPFTLFRRGGWVQEATLSTTTTASACARRLLSPFPAIRWRGEKKQWCCADIGGFVRKRTRKKEKKRKENKNRMRKREPRP